MLLPVDFDCDICEKNPKEFYKCCWRCDKLEDCLPRMRAHITGDWRWGMSRCAYLPDYPEKWCDKVVKAYEKYIERKEVKENADEER